MAVAEEAHRQPLLHLGCPDHDDVWRAVGTRLIDLYFNPHAHICTLIACMYCTLLQVIVTPIS